MNTVLTGWGLPLMIFLAVTLLGCSEQSPLVSSEPLSEVEQPVAEEPVVEPPPVEQLRSGSHADGTSANRGASGTASGTTPSETPSNGSASGRGSSRGASETDP